MKKILLLGAVVALGLWMNYPLVSDSAFIATSSITLPTPTVEPTAAPTAEPTVIPKVPDETNTNTVVALPVLGRSVPATNAPAPASSPRIVPPAPTALCHSMVYYASSSRANCPAPASAPRVNGPCYLTFVVTAPFDTAHHHFVAGETFTTLECAPIMVNGALSWTTISDYMPITVPIRRV